MRRIIICLISLSIINCSDKESIPEKKGDDQQLKQTVVVNLPFEDVPLLDYPIRFSCSQGPDIIDYSNLSSALIDLFPEHLNYLVGKININHQYVGLISRTVGDINRPILYTFNYKGILVDTLSLSGNCFSAPDDTEVRFGSFIYKNYKIEIIDSTTSYSLDQNKSAIEGTDTLVLNKRVYEINQEGKFIKLE